MIISVLKSQTILYFILDFLCLWSKYIHTSLKICSYKCGVKYVGDTLRMRTYLLQYIHICMYNPFSNRFNKRNTHSYIRTHCTSKYCHSAFFCSFLHNFRTRKHRKGKLATSTKIWQKCVEFANTNVANYCFVWDDEHFNDIN